MNEFSNTLFANDSRFTILDQHAISSPHIRDRTLYNDYVSGVADCCCAAVC